MPSRGQAVDEREHLLRRLAIRRELGDLRADVHVDAGARRSKAAPPPCGRAPRASAIGHAELVLLEPGGDVRMRPRVDVRIDAQAHRARAPASRRDVRKPLELAADSTLKQSTPARSARGHLVGGLADAREHRRRRVAARGDDARELAARDDVEAAAERAPGCRAPPGSRSPSSRSRRDAARRRTRASNSRKAASIAARE